MSDMIFVYVYREEWSGHQSFFDHRAFSIKCSDDCVDFLTQVIFDDLVGKEESDLYTMTDINIILGNSRFSSQYYQINECILRDDGKSIRRVKNPNYKTIWDIYIEARRNADDALIEYKSKIAAHKARKALRLAKNKSTFVELYKELHENGEIEGLIKQCENQFRNPR